MERVGGLKCCGLTSLEPYPLPILINSTPLHAIIRATEIAKEARCEEKGGVNSLAQPFITARLFPI